MIAGSPISSSASSAWISVLTLLRAWRGETDLGHRVAKQLAVLRLVDSVGGGADHLHAELVEHAHPAQRQRRVQRGLSAHGREKRVRTFLLDDLGDDLRRDRLDVSRVSQIRIGHDRRRIGIDQNDPVAFFLERLAGLRAGIIELARLADDDRTRADDQDRGDVGPLGHCFRLSGTKKGRACRASLGRRQGLDPARGVFRPERMGREGALPGNCGTIAEETPKRGRLGCETGWAHHEPKHTLVFRSDQCAR